MPCSIPFAAAAAWALFIGARSGTGAATAVAAENREAPFGFADLLLRRGLEDADCADLAEAYGTCFAGLDNRTGCLECLAAYKVPEGSGAATAGGGCDAAHSVACDPYESCSCVDPCLDEVSAMYTCYVKAASPPCTISCGGRGGGSAGSGGGGGGSNSGGHAAGSVAGVASLAAAAVAWCSLTQ
jgi:uncharacterized membrane protein YgcG